MNDGLVCGYLLRQINFVWERISKELLKDSELNWTQTAILGILMDADGQEMSLKGLEKALNLTQSVVARSITQMVESAYLEYKPDVCDKRAKRVHLLDKGIVCHKNIFSAMDKAEAPLLEGMSAGERLLFRELLEKALVNSIRTQEKLKNQNL